MARKVRIEYPGACYHVINRGNYRDWIFESDGARESFLGSLRECCDAQSWRLHAWCLMSNHYHLLVETPQPNLVEGMRWLQSVFANRFNRFRGERGHVFQGRYKAILLDEDAMGPVAHYIHLNPARAGLVTVNQLEQYESSSFHQLWYPRKRWSCVDVGLLPGRLLGVKDDRRGHRSYRDYLEHLSTDNKEMDRLGFSRMSWGWAKGSKAFKDAVLEELDEGIADRVVESDAAEIREHRWRLALEEGLRCLGRNREDFGKGRKAEPWKVALARYLRERCLAPYRWIAEELEMGATSYVQSIVSRHRTEAGKNRKDLNWMKLKKHGKLD